MLANIQGALRRGVSERKEVSCDDGGEDGGGVEAEEWERRGVGGGRREWEHERWIGAPSLQQFVGGRAHSVNLDY